MFYRHHLKPNNPRIGSQDPPGASSQSFLASLPTSDNYASSRILSAAVLVADKWFNGSWPESSHTGLKTSTLLPPFMLVTAGRRSRHCPWTSRPLVKTTSPLALTREKSTRTLTTENFPVAVVLQCHGTQNVSPVTGSRGVHPWQVPERVREKRPGPLERCLANWMGKWLASTLRT